MKRALFGLALCACTKHEPPKATVAPAPSDFAHAPPPVVENHGPPTLPFSITTVYEAQQPSATAPWHVTESEGAWTFFDARTTHGARFTFGILGPPPLDRDAQYVVSKGALSVPSSADAAALASEVATIFNVAPPTAKAHPPSGMRIPLEIVGEKVDCTPSVGCNDHGTWTASKLQFNSGTEVFFNWDLPGKRGELVEASPDGDRALVEILAGL